MTQARATKRRTTLEKHREEVIAFLLIGWTQQQVADYYQVNSSSVHRFADRHADRLTALSLEVERQVEDFAISQKVNRIANKDMLRSLLEEVRKARAEGKTGIETGLVVKTYKQIGSGKDAQLVEEFKIDDGLLGAIERLETSAATELAQLPRPDTHIGDKNVFYFEVVAPYGHGDIPQLG